MAEKVHGGTSRLRNLKPAFAKRITDINTNLFGIPGFETLDLRRGPFDRLPHKIVSEHQVSTAANSLNTFLGASHDGITELSLLNKAIQGIGDQIRTIIDAHCHSNQLDHDSRWEIRQPVGDGELLAFAQNDRVVVENYSVVQGNRKTNYIIYVPRVGHLKNLSTAREFGLYRASDSRNDTNLYIPEKNPHNPRDIHGYFHVLQQATSDLLEATGLSAKSKK